MEKENQNNPLTLKERVARVFGDEDFRNHCVRLASLPDFEEDFVMCEKIARQKLHGLKASDDLIYLKEPYSLESIRDGVLDFYTMLDKLAEGEINLANKLQENVQYFTTDNHGNKNARSCCGVSVKPDGSVRREIFCNMEGRVGDINTVAHEFCHSMSKSFTELKPHKDERMREVCTVIIDALSNEYFKDRFPNLRDNFNENALSTQIINIHKARESLLEGVIIKIMAGQMDVKEAQEKYDDLLGHNMGMLNHCLESIEKIEFGGMNERKYLVPQAIALEMLDKFKANPEETAAQFKEVLCNDTELTLEETLDILQLPSKDKLIDGYLEKFEARANAILDEAYEDEL